MRPSLQSLEKEVFDVVVIGAGINGSAAAHAAAQAGYRVALLDKGDYGSGSSSRSSRLLHCGLRYLMPDGPLTIFLRHPGRLLDTVRTVKRSMAVRNAFVRDQPALARPIRMHYPIYTDGHYAPWLVDVAFGLLGAVSDGKVPLDYKRTRAKQALQDNPFAAWLGNRDRLKSIASYTEYQFDWPERVVLDLAMQARGMGASVRNYTRITSLQQHDGQWNIGVADSDSGDTATLRARAILNLSGVQVDAVNKVANTSTGRKITGTKGAHIVFRLPPSCRAQGLAAVSSVGRPFYCMPWRDLHFFGPTETLYEGDPDDVYADKQDVEFLLHEANQLFPALSLARQDIVSTWAGIRPLTYNPAFPMGHRSRRIYDQTSEGMPNVLSLSNGSLGAHRQTGQDLLAELRRKLAPSGEPRHVPDTQAPNQDSDATLAQHLLQEDVVTLEDLMSRRLGLTWDAEHGLDRLDGLADKARQVLGWDDARLDDEIRQYKKLMHHWYGVR